ncbi:MAG: hypothetical protein ACXVB4_17775 [Pseudobdellovibrionaceae bacterium]
MRTICLLAIFTLGIFAQAQVPSPMAVLGHPQVIPQNFKRGVYTYSVPLNPPNGKPANQDCADDATNLIEEAKSNGVAVNSFECVVDNKGGYKLNLRTARKSKM